MRLLNIALAVLLLLSLLHVQPYKASRVLYDEGELTHKELRLQSLPRGPVPPSGHSGCTYIPGTGGSGCPVNEMHYAGNALHRPSAYPRLMVPFGVATNHQ
ncbi:hypothetical protein I3843_01G181600 [Carya illinoinensis]|uniref:Uncharacterized protein n=1 Tax=Carya illinoinensis TaxID=32201 RepID=A0A8T1RPQ3_CARIL|nr:hypothetical protein I3760_01G186400 [Carya illinoinensis]KAG6668699.1 hypothetical protein CIPAW_01G189400 [Carya illinoinensis]KAG6732657.1 hypothetical protein I3842_01G189100 [Carya illinoinensis]KAG7996837.1 hypothetical protein I3843_01G181600 [Carya illinoinensis]